MGLVKELKALSIPDEEDVVFVRPGLCLWRSFLDRNISVLADVGGRRESRRELLCIARSFTEDVTKKRRAVGTSEEVIATGHQPVWGHCGIWIKDVMACRLADAVGGTVLHIVVDHDVCDTGILLPRLNNGGGHERVDIEAGQAVVGAEWRECPDEERVEAFVDAVVGWDHGGLCSDIWSGWRHGRDGGVEEFSSVAELIVYLQWLLNDAMGLNMLYLPVSRLCESDAFLDFACRLIVDAERFARSYNAARAEQMSELGLGKQQSVRRLLVGKGHNPVEVPLWVVGEGGERGTLYVEATADGDLIWCNGVRLGVVDLAGGGGALKEILSLWGRRLRPKAVILTLFVRLFLAGWFVHGVGGGRYEYIVDRIMEDYFGISGVGFGVATTSVKFAEAEGCGTAGREYFFGLFGAERLRGLAGSIFFGEDLR